MKGPEQHTGMRDPHGQNRGDSVGHTQRTKDLLLLKQIFVSFRVFFRKNDWVVFVFRAEYLDFPEVHRKKVIYYRMSLQGESQTHYRKKYLHHITVRKLMVQGATHVLGRKK